MREIERFAGQTVRVGRCVARAAASWMVVAVLLAPAPAFAGGDWNDGEVAWQPYDEGLALAKEQGKPVCLIFYTDWCPHCTNYSAVFHDPKVVEVARDFVMIRINQDQNRELGRRYAVDGSYIPRTYFLAADGTLAEGIHMRRSQYRYFYDENDPRPLLRGMREALEKLR